MKSRMVIIVLLLIAQIGVVNANTYWVRDEEYFKYVNSVAVPGDEVDFMGSEVKFSSTINFKSGVHYQSGNDRTVISGFSKVSNWQLYSGNIYYATLDQSEVNSLVINGQVQAMGRYPDAGYITYTGHAGNGTIWGPLLNNLPANFTGGEVVVKKKRYILDRHNIKYQGHDYIEYDRDPRYGNNDQYQPTDGNGFFIQGHMNTLNKHGEWYFDKSSKRVYVVLDGAPSQYEIKVSSVRKLINIVNQAWININGLDFEGADTLLNVGGSTSVIFNNCSFSKSNIGIIGAFTDNIQMLNSKMYDLYSWGFYIEEAGNNSTIQGCDIYNIGMIPGLGNSGEGTYTAIAISGNNTFVKYNTLKSIGFNVINFHGNNVHIEKNLIDTYCVTKDDGGAIYSYCDLGEVFSDRYVSSNIILNAIGCPDGATGNGDTTGEAAGLYMDGRTNHVVLSGNFLANGPWVGILNSPSSDNSYISNVAYNFSCGVAINEYYGFTRNMTFRFNLIIARHPWQNCMLYNQFFDKEPFTNYGDFSYNLYSRPINQGKTFDIRGNNYAGAEWVMLTLDEWKRLGQDVGSQQPDIHTDDVSKIIMDYNASDVPKDIYLNGQCQGMWGELYEGKFTMAPWSGAVLIKITIT